MGEFRKQWTWPAGLGDRVYAMVRSWSNGYNTRGKIFKSRAAASARFGMELPDTEVQVRMHELSFTYPELKWLSNILDTEDNATTQSVVFAKALKIFESKQEAGRAPAGVALPFELAFTEDEVNYIRKLLECIGIRRQPTPSERAQQQEDVKKADW